MVKSFRSHQPDHSRISLQSDPISPTESARPNHFIHSTFHTHSTITLHSFHTYSTYHDHPTLSPRSHHTLHTHSTLTPHSLHTLHAQSTLTPHSLQRVDNHCGREHRCADSDEDEE